MHGDAAAASNELGHVMDGGYKRCGVIRHTEISHWHRDEFDVALRTCVRLALETEFDGLVIAQERDQHIDAISCQSGELVVQPVAASRSRGDEQRALCIEGDPKDERLLSWVRPTSRRPIALLGH